MGKSDKSVIRTLGVYIGRDFVICADKAEPEEERKRTKGVDCDGALADLRVDRRQRIAYIYDVCGAALQDLEAFKKDKRFLERCHFVAYDLWECKGKATEIIDESGVWTIYEALGKPIAEFDGDFIDALIWVNENMRRIQKKRGA